MRRRTTRLHSDRTAEIQQEILRFSNAMKCIVKQSYPTESDAQHQAERLTQALREVNPSAGVNAYQCLSCGLWHVGRSFGAPKVQLRRVSPAERDAQTLQRNLRRIEPRAFRRYEAERHNQGGYR